MVEGWEGNTDDGDGRIRLVHSAVQHGSSIQGQCNNLRWSHMLICCLAWQYSLGTLSGTSSSSVMLEARRPTPSRPPPYLEGQTCNAGHCTAQHATAHPQHSGDLVSMRRPWADVCHSTIRPSNPSAASQRRSTNLHFSLFTSNVKYALAEPLEPASLASLRAPPIHTRYITPLGLVTLITACVFHTGACSIVQAHTQHESRTASSLAALEPPRSSPAELLYGVHAASPATPPAAHCPAAAATCAAAAVVHYRPLTAAAALPRGNLGLTDAAGTRAAPEHLQHGHSTVPHSSQFLL
jgi:hypothetical protein